MNENNGTCQNCKHWAQIQGNNGECRRNPPQPGLIMQPPNRLTREQAQPPAVISYWPPVTDDKFCGEHAPLVQISAGVMAKLFNKS